MKYTLHREFPANLKNNWNALLEESFQHVPFLRYEYLDTWWQTRGGGEWPQAELAIITAEDENGLAGVAPFFKAEWEGKKCLLLLGSIEISDYLDFIVRQKDLQDFLSGLLEFLVNSFPLEWEALDLYNILEESPVLAALKQIVMGKGFNRKPPICSIRRISPYQRIGKPTYPASIRNSVTRSAASFAGRKKLGMRCDGISLKMEKRWNLNWWHS